MHYAPLIPLVAMAAIFAVIVWLDSAYGLLRAVDHFPTPRHRTLALAWLGVFLMFMTYLVVGSSMRVPTKEQLAKTPFYQLFFLHALLVLFLIIWWLVTNRPNLFQYLNIQREKLGTAILTGFAVGIGGWIFTLVVAVMIGALLTAAGVMPKNTTLPPMVSWLVGLAAWKKCLVVLSAMTIEEAFFRGWLQKRVGLIASTILFAFAHAGYAQPLLLVGVSIISLVIGTTFYRTKNLLPGVIAHGVFDFIQLFVTIPLVFNLAGS
jgi:membrane protease YdiL (CAAX protease family)